MSRKTAMRPDDSMFVDEQIRELIPDTGRLTKADIAQRVVNRLVDLDSRGDLQARRALVALAVDGITERCATLLAQERGSVRISRTGAVLSIPTRVGVPAFDEEGKREPHFQTALWWELSWDEFQAKREREARAAATLSVRAEAFNEIARLFDLHPDTLTPGEACEREGIDPRSFAIA